MLVHKQERKSATKVQIAGKSGRIPLRVAQRQARTDQAVPRFGSRHVKLVPSSSKEACILAGSP